MASWWEQSGQYLEWDIAYDVLISDPVTDIYGLTWAAPVGDTLTIDWGDGNVSTYTGTGTSGSQYVVQTHTYASAGGYTVKLKNSGGNFAFRIGEYINDSTTDSKARLVRGVHKVSNVLPTGRMFRRATYLTFDTGVEMPTSWGNEIPAGAFGYCETLGFLNIPANVTEIKANAFWGATNFNTNRIPSGVTEITSQLFQICRELAMEELPDGITTIGVYAFYQCYKLTWTKFPASLTSVGTYAFYSCREITATLLPSGITSIPNYCFYGCLKLALTSLPSGLTTISSGAFGNCPKLEIDEIPASVTTIGVNAFQVCWLAGANHTIRFIGIPTSIDAAAFAGCVGITDIYVPWDSTDEINANAPWGATNATIHYEKPNANEVWYWAPSKVTLYSQTNVSSHTFSNGKGVITYTSNLTTMPNSLRNTATTRVRMPGAITTISDGAFYRCTSLADIKFPASVTSIGGNAFSGCTALTLTALPSSVTSIGAQAFQDCSGLVLTALPAGVTTIGALAFQGCSAITIDELPDTLGTLGDNAFRYCWNTGSNHTITFLGTPTTISSTAFQNCSKLTDIYVPWSSTDAINANAPWGATNATIHYNSSPTPTGFTVTFSGSDTAGLGGHYTKDSGTVTSTLQGYGFTVQDCYVQDTPSSLYGQQAIYQDGNNCWNMVSFSTSGAASTPNLRFGMATWSDTQTGYSDLSALLTAYATATDAYDAMGMQTRQVTLTGD